jgi:membrane protease YdiL (CAAX protease family)
LSADQEIYAVPHGGDPPDPPELPAGVNPAPRWPAWYAPVGFLAAAVGTLIVVTIILSIAGVGSDDDLSPALVVALTLVQDTFLCGTAIFLASLATRPRPWHFGLRPARLWRSLGWAAVGVVGYLVFVGVYSAILTPDGEQSVTEDLGADESTLGLVAAGLVVIAVAPVAEEFFFRGFFYRALRSRLSVLAAAAIDGVVFGLIHFSGSETLELLPILAALGFMFCLVYERTGTLYTVIGLHALNNSVAYGAAVGSATVSLVLGPLMLTACILAPRLLHPTSTAAPT